MVKDRLLEYFEQHKGETTSGDALADALGVTRAAVWKAVEALRGEGYDIRAQHRLGYCLQEHSDILSPFKIRTVLGACADAFSLQVHKVVDSTSRRALLAALDGAPEWYAVASEEQTHGVGRGGRVFASPGGKGAYVSVVLHPAGALVPELIPRLAALAAARAIEERAGLACTVEKTDDVLCAGQKVCGIRTDVLLELESGAAAFAVVGIGINVYAGERDGRDETLGVSLYERTGRYLNRSELIGGVLRALFEACAEARAAGPARLFAEYERLRAR